MRALIDSILASKGIVLKPEIELDSLGPTLVLVRESDWAAIPPVIAVKQAVNRGLLFSQQIVDPEIPRDVIVASPAARAPTLAGELFLKIWKANVAGLLEQR
jgi:hypothetical protein